MHYFIEFACIATEIWMIHTFLSSMFQRKNTPWYITFTFLTLFGVIVAVLSFIENIALIRLAFSLVGVCALSIFLFKAKIFRGLLSGLIACVFISLTDILTTVIFTTCGMSTDKLMAYGFARSLYLIVGHIIMLALFMLVCVINRKSNNFISLKVVLPISPCWIISILLSCLLTWQYIHSEKELPSLYLLVMLGLLYTNIIVIYYINRLNLQAQRQKDLELATHHYEMQQEYYDQFCAQQEEIRSIWHDISKYLKAIQTDSSNLALAQVQEMVDSVTHVVNVNNRVINVILNEYVQIAKNESIDLKLDVQVPDALSITSVDLYILIGNTLDNAYEAIKNLTQNERTVSLKLKVHNEILFYEISNPFVQEYLSRPRNRFHGYGLKNVQQCVEKYNGTLNISTENNVFRITAHLNIL